MLREAGVEMGDEEDLRSGYPGFKSNSSHVQLRDWKKNTRSETWIWVITQKKAQGQSGEELLVLQLDPFKKRISLYILNYMQQKKNQ